MIFNALFLQNALENHPWTIDLYFLEHPSLLYCIFQKTENNFRLTFSSDLQYTSKFKKEQQFRGLIMNNGSFFNNLIIFNLRDVFIFS